MDFRPDSPGPQIALLVDINPAMIDLHAIKELTMKVHLAIALSTLLGGAVLAGCEDRRIPEVASNAGAKAADATQDFAQQAERQAERGLAAVDDATITAKLKTALIAEPNLKGMAVDVDTAGNVVTLNGSVASDSARARAEELARATDGVKEVRNNLTVKAQPAS